MKSHLTEEQKLKKLEWQKGHRAKHWKESYRKVKEKRDTERVEMIRMMGGKCIKCGFDKDMRALQVDHIQGGGCKEQLKISRVRFWRYVMDSFNKKEGKYQLLCANCNFIKRYLNNELMRRLERS